MSLKWCDKCDGYFRDPHVHLPAWACWMGLTDEIGEIYARDEEAAAERFVKEYDDGHGEPTAEAQVWVWKWGDHEPKDGQVMPQSNTDKSLWPPAEVFTVYGEAVMTYSAIRD